MSAPRGVERLLNVIMTIGSRRRITREVLFAVIPEYAQAASPAAAERMFERDKREILELGLALETETDPWDESVVHYRIAREGGRLPSLDLSPAEYTVLLAASRAWDEASAGGAARRVRAKLLSLGQEVDEALVRRTPRGAVESLPVLAPLLEAVSSDRQVLFRYRTATGRPAERHVEPWVVGVHVGHWYVLGHDLDRGEPRVFRASRIESFPRLRGRRTLPVPPDVSLDTALERVGTWTDERADAELLVESYKALPLRDAAGADPAEPRVHRRGILRSEARRLVLGNARWVTIAEPAAWREELAQLLGRVADRHEGPTETGVIAAAPVRDVAFIRPSASSTDHLSRLVAETAYVLARGEARLEDMAAQFGIGIELLVADLQILFVCGDLGAGWEDLIEAEWEGGWVRVRNADALGGPLRLTPTEATVLLAGLAALEPASGEERGLVAAARGKLSALLGSGTGTADGGSGEERTDGAVGIDAGNAPRGADAADDVAAASATSAPTMPATRADRILAGIQEALAADSELVIRYSPPDAPGTSVRLLRPLALESRDGRGYLRARDLGRGQERTFRLDRIVVLLDAAPAENTPVDPALASTAPTGTVPAPRVDGSAAPDREEPPVPATPAEVWLRLEPAAAWIAEAFGAEELREVPDGTGVLARLRDPVHSALVDAVLEGAGAAEVLEPSGLRDQIVTVARRAQHRHESASR